MYDSLPKRYYFIPISSYLSVINAAHWLDTYFGEVLWLGVL